MKRIRKILEALALVIAMLVPMARAAGQIGETVTGGGIIKDSRNNALWSFSGSIGVEQTNGIVGSFQLVDHQTKITYTSNEFSVLQFFHDTTSLPQPFNWVAFVGTFHDNKGGAPIVLTVYIFDDAGGQKKVVNKIAVVPGSEIFPLLTSGMPAAPWIGEWSSPGPGDPRPSWVMQPKDLTRGDFLIYNLLAP